MLARSPPLVPSSCWGRINLLKQKVKLKSMASSQQVPFHGNDRASVNSERWEGPTGAAGQIWHMIGENIYENNKFSGLAARAAYERGEKANVVLESF